MGHFFDYVPTLTYLINGHARLFISEKFSTLDTLIKAYPFISFWKNFLPPRLLKPTLLLIHLKFPSSPFSRIEIQFSRRHFQYKQTIKRPFNTYMTVKWALIFDRRCESSWFCSQIETFFQKVILTTFSLSPFIRYILLLPVYWILWKIPPCPFIRYILCLPVYLILWNFPPSPLITAYPFIK